MVDVKLCTELLLVMYLSSMALLPGGHKQFWIWFIQLIPFTLMMIGFEPLIYFNLSQYFSPFSIPSIPHISHLLICLYLLVIGPDLLRKVQKSIKSRLAKTFLPRVKKYVPNEKKKK